MEQICTLSLSQMNKESLLTLAWCEKVEWNPTLLSGAELCIPYEETKTDIRTLIQYVYDENRCVKYGCRTS